VKNNSHSKWFLRLIAALIIFIGYEASSQADTPLDRVTGVIDGAAYQLDINESQVPLKLPPSRASSNKPTKYKGYIFVREISIKCIAGCSSKVSYEEKLNDIPISAFRMRDDSPDFVTTWVSGSAYWIRIYHICHETISKVLEEGSVSAPQIKFADDGSLIILLSNPDLSSTSKTSSNIQLWRWNGKQYQINSGN
jgi:hypothetical protein